MREIWVMTIFAHMDFHIFMNDSHKPIKIWRDPVKLAFSYYKMVSIYFYSL